VGEEQFISWGQETKRKKEREREKERKREKYLFLSEKTQG
jgi:hypothetical protein